MASPTTRSLELLRRAGWTAAVTERWNQFAKIRQDLMGFCDILAISPGQGFLAIQCCAAASQAARATKIKAEPRALVWLQAGGRIFIHSWRKKKLVRGGKAFKYECNEIEIIPADFSEGTT